MSDVAVEAKIFDVLPQGHEKKWGFHVERLKRTHSVSARELSTSATESVRTDYGVIERLTQGSINRLDRSNLKVPGVIKGFRERLEEQAATNEAIDQHTHLSRLQEMFTFFIGSEERYGIPTCYNFTDTKLTNKHLTEIAEALGEINMISGSKILNLIRNIVFVPKDHPLMQQAFTQHSSGGHVFEGFPMIFISESLLEKPKKRKKTDLLGDEQQELIVSESLKASVLHEAGHLWQLAYPEEAKRFERIVIESRETLPSLHGNTTTTIDDEERHLEILPETIVALSSPETEHLVGPVTRQAVNDFQRDAFYKENGSDETIARPTYVRCRQIDLQTLVENAQQAARRRWRRPLTFISRSLAAMTKS